MRRTLILALLPACATTPNPAMETHCRDEIAALHEFFEGWFTGRLPNTDESFARFSDALAPGFEIVSPEGRRTEKPQLLDGLRAVHGTYPETFRIWIENVRVRSIGPGLWLATYEEWQRTGDDPSQARLSTVAFRQDATAPGGLAWLHVHEVWLPQ